MGNRPGYCPACERFIGPLDACPYCDCPAERQAGLRLLRALAVLLALAGLALLGAAAVRRAAPPLTVAAIRPEMNFARVRLAGTVATAPRGGTARSGEPWFGFTLDDGTGRIRVTGYGETALAIESKMGTITGAACAVEGWLTVRAGRPPSLQVRDADRGVRLGGAP